jgi:DnaK suppressor protein
MRKTTTAKVSRDRELRRILENQRTRILEALRTTVREARAESAADDGDVQDDAERSEADVQSEVEFALLQMQSETLTRVEEALDRLDSGEFGICAECGLEIPAARLKALPFAIRCRTCEQERETSGRSHSHPWTGWHLPV